MLTADDIARVRTSFARILPIKDAAADLFYQRLFMMAPQVRPLFPEDMTEQKHKLLAMLATAVGALDDLDALIPRVKALGARHAAYAATAGHYEVVGQAFLWTLARGLGESFTPDVRAAWTKTYNVLAATMQAGAAEAAALQAAE